MKKIPMTKESYEKLREELSYMKKVERTKNIKDIEEARAHGDLSENAEYHAAKERQSFIEGKIREIENKLAHAQVIDTSKLSGDKVVFGATVKLRHVDSDEIKTYTLVGAEEADIKNGKISVQSPVGKSLIGHTIGDTVNIKTPTKDIECEILEISFG